MPQRYDKLGIHFQYPDNWTIDEEDALSGGQSVTVYSPGGAFWSVAVHPPTVDPGEMALAAVDAMKEEYEEVEVEPAASELAGRELLGYDLNFFFLDLTNTARVRSLRKGRSTLTVFFQAEDHDFRALERVFQAITTSLLSES